MRRWTWARRRALRRRRNALARDTKRPRAFMLLLVEVIDQRAALRARHLRLGERFIRRRLLGPVKMLEAGDEVFRAVRAGPSPLARVPFCHRRQIGEANSSSSPDAPMLDARLGLNSDFDVADGRRRRDDDLAVRVGADVRASASDTGSPSPFTHRHAVAFVHQHERGRMTLLAPWRSRPSRSRAARRR
jgi:hypothetical protein